MNDFNILILDDVLENIYSLKMLIEEKFDVNVFTSLNAQHAIELLMKEDVDLILSDVQMPDIDGFEFADYIKNIERTRDIPIIFITGIYNGEQYKSKGYKLGAIDYITKPINIELFNSKLSIYIDIYRHKKLHEKELESKNALLIHQSKFVAMGEIINMIAHQWRQPLSAISSTVQGLHLKLTLKKFDETLFIEKLNDVNRYAQYLSQTIDDFRQFFKPSKAKDKVSLEEVIEKVLGIIGVSLENKKIQLIMEYNSNEYIMTYANELMQVLLNLIKNAEDVLLENKIENPWIKIATYKNDGSVIVSISDNGGGISSAVIERIFEPYFSTKNKKDGTGLGLYMSHKIIEEHCGGNLCASNGLDGAIFTVTLPAHRL